MPSQRNLARKDFVHAKRIVIKMGTSVVSTNGEPALGRLASLVEQISMLKRQGKEVLLVTSGSIGIGRKKLHKQLLLSASLRMHVQGGTAQHHALDAKKGAMAAAGQVGLMALYETLFSMYDVACSQVLVTDAEFRTPEHRANIRDTLLHLLEMDVLPIVNENDAISAGLYRDDEGVFTDNDSLAALIAGETSANLLILLTDVDGVFDKPPSEPHAKVLSVFGASTSDGSIVFGEKSSVGRGGMQAKIQSANRAINQGVNAVVIASGFKYGILDTIMKGAAVGTLFVPNPSALMPANPPEEMALAARDGSRALLKLSSGERAAIVRRLARLLVDESPRILAANQQDLDAAGSTLDPQLRSRLKLTHAKLVTLAQGIASVADQEEPVGKVVSLMEISTGLVLEQVMTPIGVILVVFESRPDSLPQIAALALRSGNGLLLKGGREARHSNECLHALVQDAIRLEAHDKVSPAVIGLVTTRDDVGALLALDHVVDLCIPRGSNALVSHIKKHTRIPVLGHAEGGRRRQNRLPCRMQRTGKPCAGRASCTARGAPSHTRRTRCGGRDVVCWSSGRKFELASRRAGGA
ncbi:delta l-pyrroline-5-carboxylate synthetase [Aphanomyces invadans]|uniref:Delta l-pyrroline-5-carboxylate synthetase n=1 Tax=Aphanomyces invadans TaxID=157072 RepID=A0A024UIN3_9STRA|nr:delta l-pyrroline-5-carboxylate synthetase [Aphanomyces invadans]ETW06045.1 delta l-pyrroline-5-carboxylate synthetase [Aphanomyces invadans]|eukprot:XP_008865822.1 delta l-pyrroline-5-carboxylate synthetase [Aphanomyces invadans]